MTAESLRHVYAFLHIKTIAELIEITYPVLSSDQKGQHAGLMFVKNARSGKDQDFIHFQSLL